MISLPAIPKHDYMPPSYKVMPLKIFENYMSQCSKIEKEMQFQSAKKHYLHFQKWQKINFCTRKKFKITKNAIFGLKKKQDFWYF